MTKRPKTKRSVAQLELLRALTNKDSIALGIVVQVAEELARRRRLRAAYPTAVQ